DLDLGHTLKDVTGAVDWTVDRGPGTQTASDTLDQRSRLHTTSTSLSARLVYTMPVGRGALQASLGPSLNDARSVHRATQLDPFGGPTPVEEGLLTNDFRGVRESQRGGIGYLLHHKGLRLTLGLDLQRSTLRSERMSPAPETARQTYYDLLPSMLLN